MLEQFLKERCYFSSRNTFFWKAFNQNIWRNVNWKNIIKTSLFSKEQTIFSKIRLKKRYSNKWPIQKYFTSSLQCVNCELIWTCQKVNDETIRRTPSKPETRKKNFGIKYLFVTMFNHWQWQFKYIGQKEKWIFAGDGIIYLFQ